MESKTVVSFTSTEKSTLKLAFSITDGHDIKVDGANYAASTAVFVGDHWELSVTLEAGEHTIKKYNTSNLFYIWLTKE